ncbi:flagellar assembly protein FliW [Sporosarcina sp. BI001-red]|uniref:flagellar assembly protein FliW n=1 Tax=Sporosarcina sp. BI001-red TaxID=2282866 RepID=UPI000E2641A9|nr:flagellar assembly protein FliW [Sporosarcina sp. BI001-red]REB08860.1 flagellar assembly protein FliW [Sporosarcina sp. BI001-red]
MTIQTKFHGELDIQGIPQWTFPNGLPGLEQEKTFVLLPIEGNNTFQVMQSTKTPIIGLIVSNPYPLVPNYSFEIDDPTIELLGIESQEELMVLAIMSLKLPFKSSSLNLQGPLIFNTNNHKAKQMILNDTTYNLRHPIGELAEKGAQ